jgi:putative serine protease PepD
MYETPIVEDMTSPRQRPAGRLWLSLMAAFFLFASGVGIGWVVSTSPLSSEPPAAQVVATSSTTTSTAAATPEEVAPVVVPDPPVVTAPSIVPGEEPIADIAAAVLPSMVQIEVLDGNGFGSGVGSGVIYDPDGLIMTAAHVVDGAASLLVRLNNGATVPAEVVGSDVGNDIAVLRIEREGLQAAALAVDEILRAGQLAIAVGSPWGLDSTVTSGIVSAVDRPLPSSDGRVVNMIQTDASINPGNSGGALVDRAGRVIGINVSIYSESGASDGVGFAVPIDRAYRVATALAAGGEFTPGLLGITGNDAGVGETPGAVVGDVTPGSAAEEAGLEFGDVVVSVGGKPVTGIEKLAAEIRGYQAGEAVVLGVIRDGDEIALEAVLDAG